MQGLVDLVAPSESNIAFMHSVYLPPEECMYVGTVAEAIAVAYVRPELIPRFICVNGHAVGFAMYTERTDEFRISRLMICTIYQGMGYGRAALDALIALAGHRRVTLSVHMDAEKAIGLYMSRGFTLTPSDESDHIEASLETTSPGLLA